MLLLLLYTLLKHSLAFCIALTKDIVACTVTTCTTHQLRHWAPIWLNLLRIAWSRSSIRAFQRCGVVFKKLGQLSSNEAWVPTQLQCVLKHLNNQASEPMDIGQLRLHLTRCYAQTHIPCNVRFLSIDWDNPVGTGCIAQTHRAVLRCDKSILKHVLIKIFRPHVAEQTKKELSLMDPWVRRILRWFPNSNRRYCLTYRWEHFQQSLLQQTHSLIETNNHRSMWHELQASHSPMLHNIRVPRLYEEHCVPGVIVMEWMDDAFPLTTLPMLCRQHGGDWLRVRELAMERLRLFCMYTMFESRYHHGDPHPGNFLLHLTDITDAPVQLIPIDFGVVHVKSDTRRAAMQRICEQLLTMDILSCVVEVYQMVVRDAETVQARPSVCISTSTYRVQLWCAMYDLFHGIVTQLNMARQIDGTVHFDANTCSSAVQGFLDRHPIVMNEDFVDLDVTILALNNTVREMDSVSNLFVELWSTLSAFHQRVRLLSDSPALSPNELRERCWQHHQRLYPLK